MENHIKEYFIQLHRNDAWDWTFDLHSKKRLSNHDRVRVKSENSLMEFF